MRTLYLALAGTLSDPATKRLRAAFTQGRLERTIRDSGFDTIVIVVGEQAATPGAVDPSVEQAIRAVFSDLVWFRQVFRGTLPVAAVPQRLTAADTEWAYVDAYAPHVLHHAGLDTLLSDARVVVPAAGDGADVLQRLIQLCHAWAQAAEPHPPTVPASFTPDDDGGTLMELSDTVPREQLPVTVTATPEHMRATQPMGAPTDTFRIKYNIARTLGRGGMGEVSLATDQPLRRDVAIKTLLRSDDEIARMRFVAEAQITGQLEHPNIVPVHELGIDETGRPYLAMKLVKGAALSELLADLAQGRLDALERIGKPRKPEKGRGRVQQAADQRRPADVLNKLLELFLKVCDAVSYAHARQVVHRDLKPDNLMVGSFGEVLVMDWGLAKVLGSDPTASGRAGIASDRDDAILDGADHVRTADGAIAGTPMYMPPEQAEGRIADIDARSDVYALGAVLYEMVGLVQPFTGDTVYVLLGKIVRGVVEPLRSRSRAPWEIPPALDSIIRKAMHVSPGRRYQSVAAFKADIEAWMTHRPVTAHPDSLLTKITKWIRRHPTASASGMVGGIAATLLALSVGLAIANGEAAKAREQGLEREKAEQAAGRAQAEADASTARLTAQRQQHLAMLLEGRVDDLLVELGGKRKDVTNDDVSAFRDLWDRVRPQSPTDPAFTAALGDRLPQFLRGFAELMLFDQRYPGYLDVTALDHFHYGMLLAVAGDMAAACAAFDRALALAPNHELALLNRGNARRELNQLEAAERDYTACLAVATETEALALRNRGEVRWLQRKFADARPDLEQAVALDGNNPTTHVALGMLLIDLGALREAEQSFDRALAVDSTSAKAWFGKGVTRAFQRDWNGAVNAYTEALDADPTLPQAWDNRGFANAQLGHTQAALSDYASALEADPTYAKSYNNRGILQLQMRDMDAAIADFSKAIEVDPAFPEPYVNRGIQLAKLGNYPAARADFDKAIDLGYDQAVVYSQRGLAYAKEQNLTAAALDFEKAVARAPADWKAWSNLAAATQESDRQRAAFAMQQAYTHCPDPAQRAGMAEALRSWGAEVPGE